MLPEQMGLIGALELVLLEFNSSTEFINTKEIPLSNNQMIIIIIININKQHEGLDILSISIHARNNTSHGYHMHYVLIYT